MPYKFDQFKNAVERIHHHFNQELASLRTSRATPALLDAVRVEIYGKSLGLREVGTLTAEDARTLKISLWDKSQFKAVEAGILKSNLGLTVVAGADGASLRVIFPELTEERRRNFLKLAKEKAEQARIVLRRERDKVWSEIQKKERGGELSEDEKFRMKDELQKLTDEANQKIEEVFRRKEAEILS